MNKIKLSNSEVVALVDSEDFVFLSRFTWHRCSQGYAKTGVSVGRRWVTISMHRLIMGLQKKDVDHIDQNKLNNQKSNLRFVSRGENTQNTQPRSNNKLGIKGVRLIGVKQMSRTRKVSNPTKPYTASIRHNRKSYYLGTFATAEEAARAYDKKALELYGHFCMLNFPDSKEKFHGSK